MTQFSHDSPSPGDALAQSVAARHDLLFDALFDGTIADDEFAELEAGLLESREMRRGFWERASVHGLLREAARIRFATFPVPRDRAAVVAEAPTSPVSSPEHFRRDRAASATRWLVPVATWLVAVLVTSTGVAFTNRWANTAPAPIVVHREGFEHPPSPGQDFQPTQFDVWGGDETEVVDSQHGIVPHGGSRMLRFESGHPRNVSYPGVVAEIWRFIDLDTLRTANSGGLARVDLSVFFNVAKSGGTVKPFGGVSLVATDMPPHEFRRDWRKLFADASNRPASMAAAEVRHVIDDDRTSWQRVTASIAPPAGARYLILHCFTERWRDDGERLPWESMGFYLDDIRLEILPAAEN